MKKILLALILGTSLASCNTNEENVIPENQLYNVSFNTSEFEIDVTDFKTKTANLKGIAEIVYSVFNEKNERINNIRQWHYNVNYGIINDKLPKGKYTAIICGGSNYISSIKYDNADGFYFDYNNSMGDYFAKKIDFEITGADIEQNVTLNRIVGRVDVVIADEMPYNMWSIGLRINNIATRYTFDESRMKYLNTDETYYSITDSMIGKENNTFSIYAIEKKEKSSTIDIKGFSNNDKILLNRSIPGVGIDKNKITEVVGTNVFEKENSGFKIKFDKSWDEENLIEF